MGATPQTATHLELFVRSLAPRSGEREQAAVIEEMEQLASLPGFEHTIHVCGKRVPAKPSETKTKFGMYLLNRIAVFEQWASHNGYSLENVFEQSHVDSAFTGEAHSFRVMPQLALAEYEGSDLRFVTPCHTGEHAWTVKERLEHLPLEDTVETTVLPKARAEIPETQPVSPP